MNRAHYMSPAVKVMREHIGRELRAKAIEHKLNIALLGERLAVPFNTSTDFASHFVSYVFKGCPYGTASLNAIEANIDRRRAMLSHVLREIEVGPDDTLVTLIKGVDTEFTYRPNAVIPQPSKPKRSKPRPAAIPEYTPEATEPELPVDTAVQKAYDQRESMVIFFGDILPMVRPGYPPPVNHPSQSVKQNGASTPFHLPPQLLVKGRKPYCMQNGKTPLGTDYNLGDLVMHPNFLEGEVVARREQPNGNYIISVSFGKTLRDLLVNPANIADSRINGTFW